MLYILGSWELELKIRRGHHHVRELVLSLELRAKLMMHVAHLVLLEFVLRRHLNM